MIDPVSEIVVLLAPAAPTFKIVSGAGRWQVRRSNYERPFFCVILEGHSRLSVDGFDPLALSAGDFVLIPAASPFTMSGTDIGPVDCDDEGLGGMLHGEIRHGHKSGSPDVRFLVGYCSFGSPDAGLLVSLLPQLVHVPNQSRLGTLVDLIRDEARQGRPARDVVLARLLEVLLIEALRSTTDSNDRPGLLRGLADPRIAAVVRRIHESPEQPWNITKFAAVAALSRSAFCTRFSRSVGMAPNQYLVAWRMALAKELIQRKAAPIAEIAERVGYRSASSFSVAFDRHVGMPPSRYAPD